MRFDLALFPDVERALALLVGMRGIDYAVGVLGGVEPALGMSHVAQHVVEDPADDIGIDWSPVIWNASR